MESRRYFHRNRAYMKDYRQGIIRSVLHLCRTSGVLDKEYNAIKYGFEKIVVETGRQIKLVDLDNYVWNNNAFGSADWYQEQALTNKKDKFGKQVSAYDLDALLRNDPYQKTEPHFDVIVIDKDLTTVEGDTKNRFLFGYGPYPNNIVSVNRFMKWIRDPVLRQKSLAIIAAHEFGHNLDLVNRNFNIGKSGYKRGHCNGEEGACLMEQVNVKDARSIDEQAALIFDNESWLCLDCKDEIFYKKSMLREKGIYW